MSSVSGPGGPGGPKVGQQPEVEGAPSREPARTEGTPVQPRSRAPSIHPHAGDRIESSRPAVEQGGASGPELKQADVSAQSNKRLAYLGGLMEQANQAENPGIRNLLRDTVKGNQGAERRAHTLLAAFDSGLGWNPEPEDMLTLDSPRKA